MGDLLRFVNVRLHRKSKAETLTISHTNGQMNYAKNELFIPMEEANLFRIGTGREWRESQVVNYEEELKGAIKEQRELMQIQNIKIDQVMKHFMSDNDDG